MAKYIIRQIPYMYDDSFYVEVCEGGITDVFEDKEQALKVFYEKEIDMYRSQDWYLYRTEILVHNAKAQESLHDYFLKHFNTPLITDENGYVGLNNPFEIPETATDEQVLEIIRITGIRYHTLTEFKNEPVFYAVRFDGELLVSDGFEAKWWDKNTQTQNVPFFYNSRDEAIEKFPLRDYAVKGRKQDLVEIPSILDHYISQSKGIQYDEINQELKIEVSYSNDSERQIQVALLLILKNSPIEIEEITLEQALKFESTAYHEF